MGLDMYLERKTYVKNWKHIPDEQQFAVTVKRGGKPYDGIKPDRVSYVVEQVAYWRKANAIHRFFIDECADGVDDCRDVYIAGEKLAELLATCREILNSNGDWQKIAAEKLPPQEGFFFGSTEIDEDYREDLQLTIDQLAALPAEDTDASYYYRASW